MKTLTITLLLSLLCSFGLTANINPTRAGRIWTECTGGNTYAVHVEILITGYPSLNDTVFWNFGDATSTIAPFYSFTRCDTMGNVCAVYYDISHVYSPGNYVITFETGNRMLGIDNIPNSVFTRFGLYAELIVDPNIGCNSSPVSDSVNLEVEWNSGMLNVTALNVIDPEGDSIRWWMISPWNAATGYQFPDAPGGGTFSMSQSTQSFSWNPQSSGIYTVTFLFDEYREITPGNWMIVGVTTREVLIDVDNTAGIVSPRENSLSIFPNPVNDKVIVTTTSPQIELVIYDMTGRVVQAQLLKSGENTVDVSGLAEGIYTLCGDGLISPRLMIAR